MTTPINSMIILFQVLFFRSSIVTLLYNEKKLWKHTNYIFILRWIKKRAHTRQTMENFQIKKTLKKSNLMDTNFSLLLCTCWARLYDRDHVTKTVHTNMKNKPSACYLAPGRLTTSIISPGKKRSLMKAQMSSHISCSRVRWVREVRCKMGTSKALGKLCRLSLAFFSLSKASW